MTVPQPWLPGRSLWLSILGALLATLLFVVYPVDAQSTRPTLVLEPDAGPTGTFVAVRGSGFPPNAQVRLYLTDADRITAADGSSQQPYATSFADPAGNVYLAFIVPTYWPDGRPVGPGALDVTVTTGGFTQNASALFVVTAPAPSPTPTPVRTAWAEVTPDAGYPGTQVLVRGGGFAPRAELNVLLAKPNGQVAVSGAQSYATGHADTLGNFQIPFTLPARWADGTRIERGSLLVTVATPALDQQAVAPFQFLAEPVATPIPDAPTAFVLPASGPPNSRVTVWGAGFPPNTRVNARLAGLITASGGAEQELTYDASTFTEPDGSYAMYLTIPARWPDGTPVRPGELLIFVSAENNDARASATFTVAAPSGTPTPTGPDMPQNPWRGDYWENSVLAGQPAFTRTDPRIAFDWGTRGPGLGFPSDSFSVRWTSIQRFQTGSYRFTLTVDDGARLVVGSRTVLDEWQAGPRRTVTTDVNLPAGDYPLRLDYFDRSGDAVIELSWQYLDRAPTPTPDDSVLFDDAPWNNQRGENNYFCSGFESECNYANCPKDYRIVWALYCRETSYPYIEPGLYRVTIFGEGRARIGATDFGRYGSLFGLGGYEANLPASFEFCWTGLQPGGSGFETIVQSLGTYAAVDRIRIEYVSERCR